MKTIFPFFLFTSMAMFFLGCSSDNKEEIDDSETPVELKLYFDKTQLDIKDNLDIEVDIVSGNGDYVITSSDETVAKTQLADDKIIVSFISNGSVNVKVADRTGQEKNVSMGVYSELLISCDAALITLPGSVHKSKIEYGSGGYTITDVIGDCVEFSIEGDKMLATKAIKSGYAFCRVVDKRGYSFTMKVYVLFQFALTTNMLDIQVTPLSMANIQLQWGEGDYEIQKYDKELFEVYLHKADTPDKDDYLQINCIDEKYDFAHSFITLEDKNGMSVTINITVAK